MIINPRFSAILPGLDLGLIWVASRIARFTIVFGFIWVLRHMSGTTAADDKMSIMDAPLATITLGELIMTIVALIVIFSIVFSPDIRDKQP